jgi:hypothetical protein
MASGRSERGDFLYRRLQSYRLKQSLKPSKKSPFKNIRAAEDAKQKAPDSIGLTGAKARTHKLILSKAAGNVRYSTLCGLNSDLA